MTREYETYDVQGDLDAALSDPVRAARIERFYLAGEAALALDALRDALGSTQEEFAAAASMSQENLSRIERSADVKMSTILRLIGAGGAKVELNALLPDGRKIELLRPQMPPPIARHSRAAFAAFATPRSQPARRGR